VPAYRPACMLEVLTGRDDERDSHKVAS
jgi:hypothetical protein